MFWENGVDLISLHQTTNPLKLHFYWHFDVKLVNQTNSCSKLPIITLEQHYLCLSNCYKAKFEQGLVSQEL